MVNITTEEQRQQLALHQEPDAEMQMPARSTGRKALSLAGRGSLATLRGTGRLIRWLATDRSPEHVSRIETSGDWDVAVFFRSNRSSCSACGEVGKWMLTIGLIVVLFGIFG